MGMFYKSCVVLCLLINVISCSSNTFKKLEWNCWNEKLPSQITSYLSNRGYNEITVYYDNLKEVDGEWRCYGWSKINQELYLINVSNLPNSKTGYNYLIIYSASERIIIYESEAFYDSSLEIEFLELEKSRILLNVTFIMEDEVDFRKIEIDY